MATHSSTLAWKIPWAEGPGGLQSMGSRGVWHDWETSLSLFTFLHWRRKWQPTQCSCLENPRTGEPGGLPSMGSHRVRHDWSNLAAAAACLLPWRWHIFFFVFDIYHGLWGNEEKKNASTTSKSGSIEIFYIPYIILSSKCLVRCRRFPVSSQKKYLPYTN